MRARLRAWVACVHEAGHVVAAYAQGGRVENLSVCPYGTLNGYCMLIFDDDGREKDLAVAVMAGFWAQHHIADWRYPYDCCAEDRQAWSRLIDREEEETLMQKSEQLVLKERRQIEKVACWMQNGMELGAIEARLRKRYSSGCN